MCKSVSTEASAHRWWEDLTAAYAAEQGYVFALTGNVGDFHPVGVLGPYESLRTCLARELATSRKIVVFWDRSAGFQFADELLGGMSPVRGHKTMRELYTAVVAKTAAPAPVSPAAGLLDQLAAQAAGGGKKEDLFPADPSEALVLIEQLLVNGDIDDRESAVVIDYAEALTCPTLAVTLQRWASVDSPLRRSRNPVVLIERVDGELCKKLTVDGSNLVRIRVGRPNRPELEHYVLWAMGQYGLTLELGLTTEVLANLATGLRVKDLEDVLMKALASEQSVSGDEVWAIKAQLIQEQSGGVLQVMRPKHGFEAIGGLDDVVDALRVQVGKLRRGSRTCDKGWLLMGPPGTGKTILAEALARESGVNFVMFGSVHSKYVGESERNMAKAIEIAKTMAPTIIFVDEAAEAIGNGEGYSGDSGVSDRIRGMLQNVIGDDALRGRLFFVMATNYPERLPAAMIRDGRMDKRIALMLPDASTRGSVLAALCRKHRVNTDQLDFSGVISGTEGWSGAELDGLVLRAKCFAEEADDEASVVTQHLIDALDDYIVSRDEGAVAAMTASALKFCNSRRLLPKAYRTAVVGTSSAASTELVASSTKLPVVGRQFATM